MNKRDVLTPLIVAALAIAFVAVSFLVYLTRGRPGLVQKKLRIGALLLTLTGVINCGIVGESMCYDVAMPDYIWLDNVAQDGAVHLDLKTSDSLSGQISECQSDRFSFRIEDEAGAVVQKADIVALDGAFDELSEEFALTVDSTVKTGTYQILFYVSDSTNQETKPQARQQYSLVITNN